MEINNGIIIDGVLHELCVGICDITVLVAMDTKYLKLTMELI